MIKTFSNILKISKHNLGNNLTKNIPKYYLFGFGKKDQQKNAAQ